jgi:hypothetical protein
MTFCSARLSRRFCVGGLSLVALACSGSAFTGREKPAAETAGEGDRTTESHETTPAEHADVLPLGGRSSAAPGTRTNTSAGETSAGETSTGETGVPGAGAPSADDAGGAGGGPSEVDDGLGGEVNYPGCKTRIEDNWESALGAEGSLWRLDFGDPAVDTEGHRLIVSYDDIATRAEPFRESFYVSAEVTFEGGTVLTPYPHVWNVILPSLRRNAAGTGIELGATEYGVSNSWHADMPPGFAGVTVANTNQVRVTTYIQAGSKLLALKVQSGAATYRSGWVDGFSWEMTNLGIFRWVGENNSTVFYSGVSDFVYVGPMAGCQELSDAEVAWHYEN